MTARPDIHDVAALRVGLLGAKAVMESVAAALEVHDAVVPNTVMIRMARALRQEAETADAALHGPGALLRLHRGREQDATQKAAA